MKSKLTLIEGGHWDKKGYWYCLSFLLPTFTRTETISIHKTIHKEIRVCFQTEASLTTNSNYVNIKMTILGFGIQLEVYTN